jgi:hypothetical protein
VTNCAKVSTTFPASPWLKSIARVVETFSDKRKNVTSSIIVGKTENSKASLVNIAISITITAIVILKTSRVSITKVGTGKIISSITDIIAAARTIPDVLIFIVITPFFVR